MLMTVLVGLLGCVPRVAVPRALMHDLPACAEESAEAMAVAMSPLSAVPATFGTARDMHSASVR